MKLQMSFGENLINLRKQKGWSQDDLANNLNLSRQAISKWENDTSKPDIDNIEKISKVFSVTIDDLLNNDVVKDKAVTLNVKKQEKKEKTITIVKCMIIAVIILYIINVIFKFASLLIIVNGIQKYANLSNYHYVITTYDENGLAEKEECWFKDGVTKTINTVYKLDKKEENIIFIDYINMEGYTINQETNCFSELDVKEYLKAHNQFNLGGQLINSFPNGEIDIEILPIIFNNLNLKFYSNRILIFEDNKYLLIDRKNLLPETYIYEDKNENNIIYEQFEIELNSVNNINK